jgi:hypothetical protein
VRVSRPAAHIAGVLAAVLALVAPASALAADETVTFDNLAAGTTLSTQYHDFGGSDRGVDFGVGPPLGDLAGPDLTVDNAPSTAHSAPNVAFGQFCYIKNCYEHQLWGRFTYAKQHVSLYAGFEGTNEPANISTTFRLTVFDAAGDELGQDVVTAPDDSGVRNLLSVSLASQQIVYFNVRDDSELSMSIDDLTFDNPPNPPPADFKLSLGTTLIEPGTQGGVVQGETRSFPVNISRFNKSTGNIHLAVDPSTLPAGVTADVTPADTTSPAGATVLVNFKADRNAPAATNVPVRVIATPDPTAGPGQHSIIIPLTVEQQDEYDPQIIGMEITQGIQSASLPQRNFADPKAPVPYSGVKLESGGKTIVRVWADNARPVPAAGVPASVELYGYDSAGRALPGSPIGPDGGPSVLKPNGPLTVPASMRADATSSWDFTLPAATQEPDYKRAWAAGDITLVAKFSYLDNTPVDHPCAGCGQFDTFGISSIPFTLTGAFQLLPVALPANGTAPSDPWTVFAAAKNIFPEDIIIQDYQASLDISDIANYDPSDGDRREDQNDDAMDTVEDWDEDSGYSLGDYPVGVTANVDVGVTSNDVLFNDGDRPISIVDQSRPLTSVAHEIGHGLGRLHASGCNGGGSNGQKAEDWPPDQQGWIEGVGLDRTGAGAPAPGQYRVIANPAPDPASYTPQPGASPDQWFDFMSYCASPGRGDFNSWTSDRGWDEVLNRYQMAHDATAKNRFQLPLGARLIHPRAVHGPSVVVGANIDTEARIAFVKPGNGRQLPAGLATGFTLTTMDKNGNPITSEPMIGKTGHVDGLGTFTYVTGELPATGVQAVQIKAGPTVMATVVRSPHAPKVRIITPHRNQRIGGRRNVVIRWKATDADHDKLRAKVDYSRDNGRHWKPIYIGPNKNRALLPSYLLGRSKHARVRIRINDGFNETAKVSARFISRGSPPRVHIFSPVNHMRMMDSGALFLSGTAADDTGHLLKGRALKWYVGRKLIAFGPTASYFGLGPGRHVIKLIATDHFGRHGVASAVVGLGAARAGFLVLKAPRSISRKARRVTLTVAATLAHATLIVGRQHFTVGRRPSRVRVKIRPGRKSLVLTLRLRAGGPVSSQSVTIKRH